MIVHLKSIFVHGHIVLMLNFNWLRNQGSTSTIETGPQFDVTTQSGYL